MGTNLLQIITDLSHKLKCKQEISYETNLLQTKKLKFWSFTTNHTFKIKRRGKVIIEHINVSDLRIRVEKNLAMMRIWRWEAIIQKFKKLIFTIQLLKWKRKKLKQHRDNLDLSLKVENNLDQSTESWKHHGSELCEPKHPGTGTLDFLAKD